ncbi:hypothetical protein NLM33_21375 [Bradyrhizobium sp. CCGUVB1N3]|uniref:hypothetical protein n=1 Tax=Bradyrhizobium sp. CCGUVB1N3 TaxID=2949629 RepID=UPI0020B2B114|nr:hypothetical protein [Bradyrhizobium sp. CCGUVB1N3]MCP3472869.1 hypothetical protein [Bradyrhizobium sp. CCGUVB1N3]
MIALSKCLDVWSFVVWSSQRVHDAGVPRMQRSAPRLRRGALLIRGPHGRWVPALRRIAEEALRRVRDMKIVYAASRLPFGCTSAA